MATKDRKPHDAKSRSAAVGGRPADEADADLPEGHMVRTHEDGSRELVAFDGEGRPYVVRPM